MCHIPCISSIFSDEKGGMDWSTPDHYCEPLWIPITYYLIANLLVRLESASLYLPIRCRNLYDVTKGRRNYQSSKHLATQESHVDRKCKWLVLVFLESLALGLIFTWSVFSIADKNGWLLVAHSNSLSWKLCHGFPTHWGQVELLSVSFPTTCPVMSSIRHHNQSVTSTP